MFKLHPVRATDLYILPNYILPNAYDLQRTECTVLYLNRYARRTVREELLPCFGAYGGRGSKETLVGKLGK